MVPDQGGCGPGLAHSAILVGIQSTPPLGDEDIVPLIFILMAVTRHEWDICLCVPEFPGPVLQGRERSQVTDERDWSPREQQAGNLVGEAGTKVLWLSPPASAQALPPLSVKPQTRHVHSPRGLPC